MKTTTRYTHLWSVVKEIITEQHERLQNEFIRDVYYMIGDRLGVLLEKATITQEEYNWYGTQQGYNSLRDDIWPLMEQKHGFQRPKAWPLGLLFDRGSEIPLSQAEQNAERGLDYVWDQARGFIFVEKRGEAAKLRELSEYGWTIAAGPGYPERLMRRLLKGDEKQRRVLVLHDYDPDGAGIYRALGLKTRRTKHLDIALGERVTDLGLTEDDVQKLDLPLRPSPPKYKGKPRVEISGLAVLKTRMDIENPTLAFTAAKMLALGITLSPTEVDKMEMMKRHIRWALTEGLRDIVEEAVEEITEKIEDDEKFQGTAVRGELEDMKILAPGLKEKLVESGLLQTQKTTFVYEHGIHKEALEKFTDQRLVTLLKHEN